MEVRESQQDGRGDSGQRRDAAFNDQAGSSRQDSLPGFADEGPEPPAILPATRNRSAVARAGRAGHRSETGIVITRLAELPKESLLDERALAHALGVTKRTIRRMVGRYELPPPVPFAGRSTWQAGRILVWFEARAEREARQAERDAQRLGRP